MAAPNGGGIGSGAQGLRGLLRRAVAREAGRAARRGEPSSVVHRIARGGEPALRLSAGGGGGRGPEHPHHMGAGGVG